MNISSLRPRTAHGRALFLDHAPTEAKSLFCRLYIGVVCIFSLETIGTCLLCFYVAAESLNPKPLPSTINAKAGTRNTNLNPKLRRSTSAENPSAGLFSRPFLNSHQVGSAVSSMELHVQNCRLHVNSYCNPLPQASKHERSP